MKKVRIISLFLLIILLASGCWETQKQREEREWQVKTQMRIDNVVGKWENYRFTVNDQSSYTPYLVYWEFYNDGNLIIREDKNDNHLFEDGEIEKSSFTIDSAGVLLVGNFECKLVRYGSQLELVANRIDDKGNIFQLRLRRP